MKSAMKPARSARRLFVFAAAAAAPAALPPQPRAAAAEPPPPGSPPSVLVCYGTGTPHPSAVVSPEEADAVTLPTPVAVNGRVVAETVAEALRQRGIAVRVADVAKTQPRLAELGGADAVAFVAPVYFGGTHWAVKRLIDDRNGALYYAGGSGTPVRRALCLLLAEDARRVGRAAGDFNSAGSPFPRDANRLDAVVTVREPAAALEAAREAAGRLAALLLGE